MWWAGGHLLSSNRRLIQFVKVVFKFVYLFGLQDKINRFAQTLKSLCYRLSFGLHVCVLSHFSLARLLATLWTVAHQVLLSMGFSRQENWSELPCSPPGDLPDPGIKPMSLMSPELADRFFITSANWDLAFPESIHKYSDSLNSGWVQSHADCGLWIPRNEGLVSLIFVLQDLAQGYSTTAIQQLRAELSYLSTGQPPWPPFYWERWREFKWIREGYISGVRSFTQILRPPPQNFESG